MNNQDRWADLLKNECFDQEEYLSQYAKVEKHPIFNRKHGNCPYCGCSGTFTAFHGINGELLVSCTGHKPPKGLCALTGNLVDLVILMERVDMSEALDRIEDWVIARMPEEEPKLDPMEYDRIDGVQAVEPPAIEQENQGGDWFSKSIKKKRGRPGKNN